MNCRGAMKVKGGRDGGRWARVWRAAGRVAGRGVVLAVVAGSCVAMLPIASAQDDAKGAAAGADAPAGKLDERGRRIVEGPATALAFKNVSVEDMIPFIVEVTGKVVLPQQAVLSRKVTVLNDRKIPREEALDLVVLALQQNGVAVVETDTTITLRDIGEITRQDVPVIGPDQSVLDRRDLGTFVEKVFRLKYNTAKKMGDVVKGGLPEFAKLSIDEESNQLSVLGNIALLQRVERLVNSLDRPAAGALQTETYRMRYADASSIKKNIEDLFGAEDGQQNRTDQNRFQPWMRNQQQGEEGASTSVIKVTANTSQNSVTVAADGVILSQIRALIEGEWDQPLPEEAIVPRIYELKHSDPVKVANLLTGLFGAGTTGTANRQGGNQQGQNNQQNQNAEPSAGQGAGRLAGQFTFQPIADAGRLVVIAKSPDNLVVIDKIIEGLDMPQTVGLPEVIELKHANAEDLAEQLNALLAQEGTLAQIRRAEEGLSAGGATGASPFADASTTANTDEAAVTRDTLSFWWQRARTPTDRRNASNLIGLIRIVPVWRQNAIMVVAPPEYKSSIGELVLALDKPGRQVLISAIVAEVSREDALSLGLRWGSGTLTPSNNGENAISIGTGASGQSNNFASSLFDTSLLTVNTNVNALLQALSEKTSVSILSEPKVFTSDNQEAEFFDGQDIPFVTDSQTNAQGNLVQSFDYRAVGINLRARPRITIKGDVDLRVNLELSSIVPGETLFGGFVVDRRETTTQLVVGNGQTVVISGILREENTNIIRKVPLLGDIPLLGELFKSRDITKTNTELLVFITPVVVNNSEENVPANERFIDRLQGIRTEARPNEDKEAAKQREKDRVPLPGDEVFDGTNKLHQGPVLPGEQR